MSHPPLPQKNRKSPHMKFRVRFLVLFCLCFGVLCVLGHEEPEQEESFKKTYNRNGMWNTIFSNIKRTLPLGFYASLGASTQKPVPYLGTLHYSLPIIYFVSGVWGRWDTASLAIQDPTRCAQFQDRILAEYVMNGLLAFCTAIAVRFSTASIPVIVTFLVTDLIAAGDNSPTEQLKDILAGMLDSGRGV